mmetsp:Transcript_24886/g.44966  ORF Transcript_24886/g.44966 Transcript_24886/m.44966 type:complete len:236 (+) Transcript_24886:379-1086(+)
MRPLQCEHTLVRQRIPSVSVEVIIPPKHKPSRFTERHGRNTAGNFVALEFVHLPITSHIEQTAGRIVRSRPNGKPVRKECHRVNILRVARVGLDALPIPKVPNFRRRVHAPRNENVAIFGTDRHGHDIPSVIGKRFHNLPGVNIPIYTTRIPRGRHDVPLVHEAAATEVAIMPHEFLRRPGIRRLLLNIVDRTDVVQPTAGDQISLRLFEGARHDPRRAERDGLDFIRGVSVPDN